MGDARRARRVWRVIWVALGAWILGLLAAPILLALPVPDPSASPSDPSRPHFPKPPSLDSNVEFWKQIYSRYTTAEYVFHDREDLLVVYGVLDLRGRFGDRLPGGRLIEQEKERARQRYADLLRRVAAKISDPASLDDEERRICELFSCQGDPTIYLEAISRIRAQLGQKDRFLAGIVRAGAYLQQITQILREHGLPTELAVMPLVESSFETRAVSKAKAVGIWQFTRDTARAFMRVSRGVDERLDPIRSTVAAAELLKKNHQVLGNWPLAVTAYNHGREGLLAAKRAVGSDDIEVILQNYRGRGFGFASRNFYAEFLAALEVTTEYGWHLVDHDAEDHRPGSPPPRPASRQRFASSTGPRAAVAAEPTRAARYHRVKGRESLWSIARAYRVSLESLRAENRLGRTGTIYPGQVLKIPRAP
ncbi:MAG: transglycosylase SLT domain-containing protein [Deltaproteobacteria bacterium]|nr:transglycosylase SLT domain-containing protein [Deltaproteobacteria bacterium]